MIEIICVCGKLVLVTNRTVNKHDSPNGASCRASGSYYKPNALGGVQATRERAEVLGVEAIVCEEHGVQGVAILGRFVKDTDA